MCTYEHFTRTLQACTTELCVCVSVCVLNVHGRKKNWRPVQYSAVCSLVCGRDQSNKAASAAPAGWRHTHHTRFLSLFFSWPPPVCSAPCRHTSLSHKGSSGRDKDIGGKQTVVGCIVRSSYPPPQHYSCSHFGTFFFFSQCWASGVFFFFLSNAAQATQELFCPKQCVQLPVLQCRTF